MTRINVIVSPVFDLVIFKEGNHGNVVWHIKCGAVAGNPQDRHWFVVAEEFLAQAT
jgi:hypothetical protein